MAILTSLPPEISREILSYLPISTLLAFDLTSKYNHAFTILLFANLAPWGLPFAAQWHDFPHGSEYVCYVQLLLVLGIVSVFYALSDTQSE